MVQITAAFTKAPDSPFEICPAELDDPRKHEVLVRIKGVGICHTDLSIKASGFYAPGVLGHEGAGIVEKVGSAVTRLAPGDKVVLSYYACHQCANCSTGHTAYCDHFQAGNVSGGRTDGSSTIHIDGNAAKGSFFYQSSFATHAIAHENNAVKVPSDLPIETLGPLGCGFLTGAGAVLNTLKVSRGEGVAVFGAGAVGLAAVMAAKAVDAFPIIVIDILPEKLEIARSLGATHVIKGDEIDAVNEIQDIIPGGVSYALECVGSPTLLQQAFKSLRPTGTCVLLGVSKPDAETAISLPLLLQGRTIKGAIEGDSDPQSVIGELIDLYRQGRFPFDRLIRTYPFDQINDAVADMTAGRVIKPVLLLD